MIFNQTEKQEKEYLQQVITIINDTINTTSTSVKEHIDTLQEYKDYLWSNKDIDPHEIRSMRESILNHFAIGENVIDKRRRLSKILDIPYFGRIDFQEKKDKSLINPIYIGIHTFYDFKEKRNLIYDWRAPISSMFYDHELGEATYSSPAGEINGTILLKRQYRIRKGNMEYMIESSVTVHDDILQKELCSDAQYNNAVAACAAASENVRNATNDYNNLVNGDASEAAALTKKDVKDASTLDALNKELSVELPVYEGCVADDTAGFKSATAKLNEQADWYKAYTQSLQKAVDAVNASKK